MRAVVKQAVAVNYNSKGINKKTWPLNKESINAGDCGWVQFGGHRSVHGHYGTLFNTINDRGINFHKMGEWKFYQIVKSLR